jgi:RNA polymerase sporulation-specific sigma factor
VSIGTGNYGVFISYSLEDNGAQGAGGVMFSYILSVFSHLINVILGIGTPQNFPPPLPTQEEHECFLKAEAGDEEARQKLILHNLRLVSHIVKKYYSTAKNPDDLVSIGTIGLVKAIDSFRVENGTKFATYGAKCIQNEILMHFRSQKKLSAEVSINETIDIDRDGNPLTYIDVVCCEEDIADEIDRKITTEKMLVFVEKLLSPRERQIIMMRYGLGGIKAQTQREIAESLGISRSYVSRIEKAALATLRDALK